MKTRLALVISALFSVALVAAPTAVMGQGKFDDKGGKSAQGGKGGGGKGGGAKAGPGNAKGGMAGAKKVQKKQSAAKKKAPAKQSSSQDWGRFNSSAQKDFDKLEKQKKAGK